MALQQMRQLVNQDVLQALDGLFRQFQIQPDALGFDIARTPFGFHPLDAPGVDRNAQDGLPLVQQLWNEFFQLCTVKRMENFLFFSGVVSGRTVKSIEALPRRVSRGEPPSSITLRR